MLVAKFIPVTSVFHRRKLGNTEVTANGAGLKLYYIEVKLIAGGRVIYRTIYLIVDW